MKEKSKHLRSIQNMMVLALLVFLFILTTQTSAIAQDLTRAQIAVILGQGIHGSNFTPSAATGIFDDVSMNDRGADWIEQFYKDGITSGCGQNPLRYCPDKALNRAAMAVFLLRSKFGKNYIPPKATGIFDDVPVTHWAADWIEQLYREIITSGCSASPLRYCPESSVTGIQMSILTARTFGGPRAAVPVTGVVLSCDTGDDGDLQKGVQSPDPRFTDNGDGTATDNMSGLIWLKSVDCIGRKNWNDALLDSNNMADGQCGLTDGSHAGSWRLPNVRELHSLIAFGRLGPALPEGHPFTWGYYDIQIGQFWTSTNTAFSSCVQEKATYAVSLLDAGITMEFDRSRALFVWPVRGGN